jgi:hypothetical protein
MDERQQEAVQGRETDVRALIRDAIQEYVQVEQSKAEPAYKAELMEERKRREQMERRLNELVEENQRTKKAAEEADRSAHIRAELQRLGVAKIDLAFKAVKDDIHRGEDGRLIARAEHGEVAVRDYLAHFVSENPELLPARMVGGSGAGSGIKGQTATGGGIDLDRIKPGMSQEDLDRVRREIARIASQSHTGL